jgi:hypothetical protein
MILRVLAGLAPRDDFSHLSLAQQVISSGCGQLHNPPSGEVLRITLPQYCLTRISLRARSRSSP